jgi:CRP/FNR family transcriptional regulator, cyclic AMP receptor protein
MKKGFYMSPATSSRTRRDPLAYLHKAPIVHFAKGDVIFDTRIAPARLLLVLSGRVAVFHSDQNGRELLLRIAQADALCGESALAPGVPLLQRAVALRDTEVMTWSPAELEVQILREPQLGSALMEEMCARLKSFRERIFGLAVLNNRARLIFTLLDLAETIGEVTPEGAIRVTGLTHQLIADFTATSREIVTMDLNRLRKRGAISYSRRYLDISRRALALELRDEGLEGFCRSNETASAAA